MKDPPRDPWKDPLRDPWLEKYFGRYRRSRGQREEYFDRDGRSEGQRVVVIVQGSKWSITKLLLLGGLIWFLWPMIAPLLPFTVTWTGVGPTPTVVPTAGPTVAGVCTDIVKSQTEGGVDPLADARYTVHGKEMVVLGKFRSTDSPYWASQPNGWHRAWDVQGNPGTPARTPTELVYRGGGTNTAECCAGDWSVWEWLPGERIYGKKTYFYYGHLADAPKYEVGITYPAGTPLGNLNQFAHVHWHISHDPGGGPWGVIDPEEWWSANCSGKPGDVEPSTDMEAIVAKWADKWGVRRSIALAMMQQESGGDPNAISPVGATGLLQIMPATGVGIARDLGIEKYDLRDPETNARFGMYYISQKIKRYGVMWGLAAYNWGPENVDAFLERHPEAATMSWDKVVSNWGAEIPEETQGYVRNILAAAGCTPAGECP